MIIGPETQANRIVMNAEPSNVLHIYGQDTCHGEAQIVGTRDALMRLRDTLDTVLQTENLHDKIGCSANFFTNDCERYEVTVICSPDFLLHQLPPPYTDLVSPA